MSEQAPGGSGGVERGASEEASGVPLTPTEEELSRRAPSDAPHEEDDTKIPLDDHSAGRGGQRPEEFNPDDFE